MIQRAALVAGLTLLLFACPRAHADVSLPLGVTVDDCAADRIDRAALGARIAVELTVPPGEIRLDDVGASTAVRIAASCGSGEIVIVVATAAYERTRRADLGEMSGVGRVWALALLVAELLRDVTVATPREARDGGRTTPDARRAVAVDPERARDADADESAAVPVWLGVGLTARVYADVATFVPGLELALAHDWIRVALGLSAMGVPSELGTITFGVAAIEIGVRPLRWRGSSIEMSAGLTLSGGAVYAAGIATRPDVRARDGVDGIFGVGLAAEIGWRIVPETALEVGIGAGYDVLGPRLQTPERVVAALRGFRGGLTVAVRLPI